MAGVDAGLIGTVVAGDDGGKVTKQVPQSLLIKNDYRVISGHSTNVLIGSLRYVGCEGD